MATHEAVSGETIAAVGVPEGGTWLGPFRALRHRNYLLFFFGQMVSLVGSWVQTTAMMWLAFHLTGTSRWPAIIAAAQMLPAFFLGAWGGVLADQLPRRRLVFQTQSALMLLALLLALVCYFGEETVWLLLAISLSIGFVNAIDLPARLAFLVEMVGRDDLVNAVGLNSLLFNLARAAGPALGIWLLPLGGAELCFLINAASFLAVLAALAAMRLATPVPSPVQSDGWSALREGFRYVAGHRVLGLLLPLTMALAILGWPLLALLPALAEKHLRSGGSGYSSLLSAVGLGALAAAFLVAAFGSLARRWVFVSVGVVLSASSLVGLSFAGTLPAGMVCAGLAGAGLILFFATSQAVFQLSATDQNRGRIMGIYSIVLAGANPLGNLLAGPAADHWGVPIVLRLQGGAVAVIAVAVLVLRLLRPVSKVHETTPAPGPTLLPFPTASNRRAA